MAIKKEIETGKVYFGRPGNNLKIGVVGLPNVGKSTLFNAITKSAVAAENYPFCTLDPEESRAQVDDPRWDYLCELVKPVNKIPAYLTVIDIAGLVKNAAAGEGLGNAFLSHIKAVDAIFHVVRAFKDEGIIHVEGDVDPIRDLEIIHNEIRLKDIEHAEFSLQAAKNALRGGVDKAKKQEVEVLEKALEVIQSGKDIRYGSWNSLEVSILNKYQFLTAKPVIYLVNISQKDLIKKKNKWIASIREWVEKNAPGSLIIPLSAEYESNLQNMESDEEREAFMKEKTTPSSLPKVINAGYNELNLIRYFTVGVREVRSWTIRRGTKAPQAAGVIHTDFERGFIAAEVIKYEDMVTYKSESNVKAHGRYLLKGKEYVVEDGDIIHFKFNTTDKKK